MRHPLPYLLLILLIGCTAPPATPDLRPAQTALARGEYEQAIDLAAPHAWSNDTAAEVIAYARLGRAQLLARTPEARAVRMALDQVALAQAAAPPRSPPQATARAMEATLITQLAIAAADRTPIPAGTVNLRATLTASPVPTTAPTEAIVDATATDAPGSTPVPINPPTRTPLKATPRPVEPSYSISQRKSFEGSGSSDTYASCIDIQVLGRNGPVSGAILGINNGEHSYQNQTDATGYAGRCGLGASTWTVILFWTPAGNQARPPTTTVYVNGAPEQRAAVVFQER